MDELSLAMLDMHYENYRDLLVDILTQAGLTNEKVIDELIEVEIQSLNAIRGKTIKPSEFIKAYYGEVLERLSVSTSIEVLQKEFYKILECNYEGFMNRYIVCDNTPAILSAALSKYVFAAFYYPLMSLFYEGRKLSRDFEEVFITGVNKILRENYHFEIYLITYFFEDGKFKKKRIDIPNPRVYVKIDYDNERVMLYTKFKGKKINVVYDNHLFKEIEESIGDSTLIRRAIKQTFRANNVKLSHLNDTDHLVKRHITEVMERVIWEIIKKFADTDFFGGLRNHITNCPRVINQFYFTSDGTAVPEWTQRECYHIFIKKVK